MKEKKTKKMTKKTKLKDIAKELGVSVRTVQRKKENGKLDDIIIENRVNRAIESQEEITEALKSSFLRVLKDTTEAFEQIGLSLDVLSEKDKVNFRLQFIDVLLKSLNK